MLYSYRSKKQGLPIDIVEYHNTRSGEEGSAYIHIYY